MRTVGVLPFVNASPDAANEYLSDGITDALIDARSHVEGVRVASRTSVFALKGRALDVRAIGALLGVTVVLEGSVRRVARQWRVTAQLTATDDGPLLWSQRHDRELDDVLAVQDEIARTIVTTLRATWFTDLAAPPPRRPTTRPEAYRAYLRSRCSLNKRAIELNPTAEESLRMLGLILAVDGRTRDAVETLREAVTIDGAGSYTRATVGYALACHGDRNEARRLLAEVQDQSAREYVSPVALATLLLGLDEREGALDYIEAAHAQRRGWLCYLAVNPIFDPVRSLPRYAAHERQIGLTAPVRRSVASAGPPPPRRSSPRRSPRAVAPGLTHDPGR